MTSIKDLKNFTIVKIPLPIKLEDGNVIISVDDLMKIQEDAKITAVGAIEAEKSKKGSVNE